MKRLTVLTTIAIAFLFLASAAGAATISVGPTGNYGMFPGDTVNFDVYFTADADGDVLSGATLSLGYDAVELNFLSYDTPLGWEEIFGLVQDVTLGSGSYLANYNQNYPWGGNPIDVGADQSISLGTFTFEATGDLIADGLHDLWIVDAVTVPDATAPQGERTYFSTISFNNSFGEPALDMLTAQGADVAPVPVPAAVWLLGSGLFGLIGIRRKNA